MQSFKTKSLKQGISDSDIENGCRSTRFISFEAAIMLFRERYNLLDEKEKPIGYRITEQGIEIVQGQN